jgi:hypothetical protein
MLGALPPPPVPLKGGWRPNMNKSAPPLPAWPPLGYRGKPYEVATGQTWQSVALAALIPDPLDVTYFNFGTTDPGRINTYLHHYVGCSYPADDKKNFRFSDLDFPGEVFWPPLGYRRSEGRLPFHAEVMVMLEQEMSRYPDLTLGDNHRVTPDDLRVIVEMMRLGRVGVKHVPGLKDKRGRDAAGLWDPDHSLMKLRNDFIFFPHAGKTVVHEATHAINEYQVAAFGRPIRVWQDEFLAYTAAALWWRAKDNATAETAMLAADTVSTMFAALFLAHYLRAGGGRGRLYVSKVDKDLANYRVPDTTVNPVKQLKVAIREHYPNPNQMRKKYDGIG